MLIKKLLIRPLLQLRKQLRKLLKPERRLPLEVLLLPVVLKVLRVPLKQKRKRVPLVVMAKPLLVVLSPPVETSLLVEISPLVETSPLAETNLLVETSQLVETSPLAETSLLVMARPLLAEISPLVETNLLEVLLLLVVTARPLLVMLSLLVETSLLAETSPPVVMARPLLAETSPLVMVRPLLMVLSPLAVTNLPEPLSELPNNNKIILLVSEDRRQDFPILKQGSLCFIRWLAQLACFLRENSDIIDLFRIDLTLRANLHVPIVLCYIVILP